ncbi:MAG TPA: 16S rRNA (guanine(966)-N(2))-methyltransferase RsmD [Candidatus Marinimicrobia bacterium]|nr:16S rRNA (guanine(966)-N(2))-methyltransferase RsmD [Candidatus Neomarinimicrobiota bacterium]HRS52328.1 16S rRNA (guanine(966)-N(2))-methyltransferase RsmD [Candidatus Neomarinimicrobiota bacterium]HRU92066.1 16S rRNA (guanine(966)-N(2))-methyltransferase RsmD [Candidatus Neomarinimicrobiota bacterium]
MVRVIAGLYKNQSIMSDKKATLRPTQDRVKAALFSILGDISGLKVADLFAGTGNLGIEALSRGAEHCTFVDNNWQSLALIEQNLSRLKLGQKAEIIQADVLKYLAGKPVFDLILADPPYEYPNYDELLMLFSQLQPATRIVLETDCRFGLPATFKPREIKTRKSGDTNLNFIRI